MSNQGENNVKLGVFVLAGLLTLIFAFYMIGKNRNLFGSNFELKARFTNLNGLIEGNNILFSGIQAGTVKSIGISNDTTIEVVMQIDNKIKPFIHKNALATIGTEGLMGDKVINISPSKGMSPKVEDGDLISTRKIVNTDDMLQTLSKTNNNIADISEVLKTTVSEIDKSPIWKLFNDNKLASGIRATIYNINKASGNAEEVTKGLAEITANAKSGKGIAGTLLSDTTASSDLRRAIANIETASKNANEFTIQLNALVGHVNKDLSSRNGLPNLLLRDSVAAKDLAITMENIRKGTDGFNQNMEALKHNFLLRGYFRKQEKKRQKEDAKK